MNRRDWMKTLASAAVVKGLEGPEGFSAPAPGRTSCPQAADSSSPNRLETEVIRLNLRHTWTTTMSSSAYRDTLYVRITRDGITAVDAQRAVQSVQDLVAGADPWQFQKLMTEVFHRVPGQYAAKAPLDIALMDWVGQKLGVPLYRYFGLDPNDTPITTFSIGIDTPKITRQKVREAEPFPVLKIKVGIDTDEATIAAVRSVTTKPCA